MSSSAKKAAKEAFDIHPILDAVGFVPVLGEPADLVNGLIYASEKDYINAGLSMAAVIPVIGEAGKMTKYGAKAIEKSKGLKKIGKSVTKPLSKKSSKTYQAGKKSLKKTADDIGEEAKIVAKDNRNIKARFTSDEKMISHFEKHAAEFKGAFNSVDEYLKGAQNVIQNGYRVEYMYKGEIRVGYVQFMGNNSRGNAKFAFVGTNNAGNITTFHTESGKTFWKLLNGTNTSVINPK